MRKPAGIILTYGQVIIRQNHQSWQNTFTAGYRYEWWKAFDGAKTTEVSGSMVTNDLDDRSEDYFSPKAAITYLYGDNWSFRLSAAKAYRFLSVRELFYGSMDADGYVVNSNPDLKCKDVFSMDFTITRALGDDGRARLSFFHNKEKDSIFSQTNIYTLVKIIRTLMKSGNLVLNSV